jgi:hypothetical protein
MDIDTSTIACVPSALTSEQRSHSRQLRAAVAAAIQTTLERPDGFTFELRGDHPFQAAAAWISLERRCCPFLAFELAWPAGASLPRLTVTGPEGTKDFLRAEMPELPAEGSQESAEITGPP